MSRSINLVFLGWRGGGNRFLIDLVHYYKTNNVSVICFISEYSEDLEELLALRVSLNTFKIPKGIHLFRLDKMILVNVRLFKSILKSGNSKTVFVMPHPWDVLCQFFIYLTKLKKNKMDSAVVIHDFYKHEGDLWPRNRSIRARCKINDEIIFLSNFVKNQAEQRIPIKNKHIKVLPLLSQTNLVVKKEQQILFVGRGKKYQNPNIVPKIVQILSQSLPEWNFIVSGMLGKKIEEKKDQRVTPKKIGWISDEELNQVIGSSSLLVLPYLESSQSGLIAKALALKTCIVVTPYGGAPSQIRPQIDGEISRDGTPIEIANSVMKVVKNIEMYQPEFWMSNSGWLEIID